MKIKRIKKIVKIAGLIVVFLGVNSHCFAQRKISPYIGVAEYQDHLFAQYLSTDLNIGVQFDLNQGYLVAYGVYQLYGSIKTKTLHGFIFSSHLVGVGGEYCLNKEKRFAFILGLSALTEVGTNFRNGYLLHGIPSLPKEYSVSSGGYDPIYTYYYGDDFYYSTPLVASIWVGCDFRIAKGFRISLSVENSVRIIKTRHMKWQKADMIIHRMDELIEKQPIETKVMDRIGLRLGLSYAFSLKSKTTNK